MSYSSVTAATTNDPTPYQRTDHLDTQIPLLGPAEQKKKKKVQLQNIQYTVQTSKISHKTFVALYELETQLQNIQHTVQTSKISHKTFVALYELETQLQNIQHTV